MGKTRGGSEEEDEQSDSLLMLIILMLVIVNSVLYNVTCTKNNNIYNILIHVLLY